VLADRPDLVDEGASGQLADNPASLVDAFAAGATTFTEAGGPDAYFGFPARATAGEGAETSMIMARAIVMAARVAISQALTVSN
jgi:creatinine amidohydrolase